MTLLKPKTIIKSLIFVLSIFSFGLSIYTTFSTSSSDRYVQYKSNIAYGRLSINHDQAGVSKSTLESITSHYDLVESAWSKDLTKVLTGDADKNLNHLSKVLIDLSPPEHGFEFTYESAYKAYYNQGNLFYFPHGAYLSVAFQSLNSGPPFGYILTTLKTGDQLVLTDNQVTFKRTYLEPGLYFLQEKAGVYEDGFSYLSLKFEQDL